MKALILLGGLGTRLRPLTLRRPKPLLLILNRPFLSYPLEALRRLGIREVILALGHQAAHFRRHLGSGGRWGIRFRYSIEREPLGTGGAIRHALNHIDGATLVLNGDVFSDMDWGALVRRHERTKAQATLALVEVANPASFGLVRTGPDGRIRGFLEKPASRQITSRTVNAGCYVFEPEVVRRIPAGRAVSIEREIFPALIREGYRVQGCLHRGYWSDIGTLKSYWRTHADLHARGPRGTVLARGAKIHPTARVRGTAVLGEGVRVGRLAVLEGHVTLGPRARVDEGARVSDSVILENARIGARSVVEKSIVGPRASIGADSRVGPDHVVGEGSRLSPFSQTVPGLSETA